MIDAGLKYDESTGKPTSEALETFYEEWVAHVKISVPEDQLLVFDSSAGWEPLCGFLSPASDDIAAACEGIMPSNYPHTNDASKLRAICTFLHSISVICKVSPFAVLALVALHLRKRTKSKPE
ncbi:hypothetical protein ACA910_012640 [Epithemia clementina (nom. ined.)]